MFLFTFVALIADEKVLILIKGPTKKLSQCGEGGNIIATSERDWGKVEGLRLIARENKRKFATNFLCSPHEWCTWWTFRIGGDTHLNDELPWRSSSVRLFSCVGVPGFDDFFFKADFNGTWKDFFLKITSYLRKSFQNKLVLLNLIEALKFI